MAKMNGWKSVFGVFFLWTLAAISASAQNFTTLFDFNENDGSYPARVTLAQGIDGNLYGTTSEGGNLKQNPAGFGTVFSISTGGELTTLYAFCVRKNCTDGQYPPTGLLLTTDGVFYGVTQAGGIAGCGGLGCGTIFKLTRQQTLKTIYSFCNQGQSCLDGYQPVGALIQASNGHLYGTTAGRGAFGYGTIFSIRPDGALSTIFSFNATDGATPEAALIEATDGDLYGGTASGGDLTCNAPLGCGTIFKVTPQGVLTTLHVFENTDGKGVDAPLIQASDGNLYGTTAQGGDLNCQVPDGTPGCGTIFRITREGSFSTLHKFIGSDGIFPARITQATDGDIYGVASEGGNLSGCMGSGCGTIFRLASNGVLTTLHEFDLSDGAGPAALLQSTNGEFYGTTGSGGTFSCPPYNGTCGTVFSLDMQLGPFVAFVQGSGRVGQTGGILGQGLTGTTSVSLNGILASFTVLSDTFIQATVPPGATTGYVTVTTPSGTLTSNVPFHVIK